MKYSDFEYVLSAERISRYHRACGGDSRNAMTLYRYNLQLSQEMFSVISFFEVALRNAIDRHMRSHFGNDWLRDSVLPNGIFQTNTNFIGSARIIENAYQKLMFEHAYSHTRLLTTMEFGVWKYMFSTLQYRATGQTLLLVFPNKQRSTPQLQINQAYIYNELDKVNKLRNRIAHHEPICFLTGQDVVYTDYIKKEYQNIQTLFSWMGINGKSMLYGLDHVLIICNKIDLLIFNRL